MELCIYDFVESWGCVIVDLWRCVFVYTCSCDYADVYIFAVVYVFVWYGVRLYILWSCDVVGLCGCVFVYCGVLLSYVIVVFCRCEFVYL